MNVCTYQLSNACNAGCSAYRSFGLDRMDSLFWYIPEASKVFFGGGLPAIVKYYSAKNNVSNQRKTNL